MKYVMFEVQDGRSSMKRLVPIIFPDFMVHVDAKQYIRRWLHREHDCCTIEPVSAGFIDFLHPKHDGIFCHGESESLQLKSRPEDARIIETYNYTHGFVL